MEFNFVDICAGIGGFHAALASMGGTCVGAWEVDENAAKIYQENWGIDPRGDVTNPGWYRAVDAPVDILCAGFPCQPFSKSGAQRGMEEARGTIFHDICQGIAHWQPKVVMLENVRNITGPKHTHTWEVVIRSLRELGYRVSATPLIVSPHWLEADAGGKPQSRERVFILGTRIADGEDPFEDVEPTYKVEKRTTEWDLAEDLPLMSSLQLSHHGLDELRTSPEESNWISAWSNFVDECWSLGSPPPSFPIWTDSWFKGATLEAQELEFPGWKRKIIERNERFYLDNEYKLDAWKARWSVDEFPASRRKFEWQAGSAKTMDDCLVQMRPSGLRVKRATHTGALVAIDQRPIVVSMERRLGVRECARLQGFPETFTFNSVSNRAAFKQLGNAVCVSVVKNVLTGHLSHPRTIISFNDTY